MGLAPHIFSAEWFFLSRPSKWEAEGGVLPPSLKKKKERVEIPTFQLYPLKMRSQPHTGQGAAKGRFFLLPLRAFQYFEETSWGAGTYTHRAITPFEAIIRQGAAMTYQQQIDAVLAGMPREIPKTKVRSLSLSVFSLHLFLSVFSLSLFHLKRMKEGKQTRRL